MTAHSAEAVEFTDCVSAERGGTPHPHLTPNKCPAYDIKQSDDKASVMLELWGM